MNFGRVTHTSGVGERRETPFPVTTDVYNQDEEIEIGKKFYKIFKQN